MNDRAMKPIMTRCALILALVGLAANAGCGGDGDAGRNTADAGAAAIRPAAVDPAVPSVAVDRLVRSPQEYRGRLAIQGVVVQSHAERGALLLVDHAEFQSCGLQACTDAAMPVRFAPDDYTGTLPQPGEAVTLLGDFTPGERGFAFELLEIHRQGGVVFERRRAG
jgi:hypothetical protein